jgi:hypothetical protein
MDLSGGLGACLGQGLQEAAAVEVVLEDGFAAVAAVHDVIDGARIFDAEFASHAGKLAAAAGRVKCKNMRICGTDPFFGPYSV